MNDHELVQKVLGGDQQAFGELIRRHQRLVAHMVARLVDNDQDREELCQDVFLKVYEHLGTFRYGSKLSTWIATIAYRSAVNFLKRRKRLTTSDNLDHVDFPGGEASSLDEEDFSRFIHRLIERMPDSYRTILTLYHLEGFSYPEIVEVTGMPEGTVKNYLFRARSKLKDLVTPYIGTEIHSL